MWEKMETLENKESEHRKIPQNFVLLSLLFVIVTSVLLYWAPYFDWLYLWLERITNDSVIFLLNSTGVYSEVSTRIFPMGPDYADFGEASLETPGINIPGTPYSTYWIIKACTGMQAGAVLISLIFATPIPQKIRKSSSFKESVIGKSQILLKFKVAILFFILLFITNSIRIWFHLYLVGALELPFSFAHDDLSKPIGFFGTIFFAWFIERQGIPIINTFAEWIDSLYDFLLSVKRKILA